MFNCRVLVKDDAVIVLNARVFLVGHLDLAVGESVDLIFEQKVVVVVSLVVEKCSLNLGPSRID